MSIISTQAFELVKSRLNRLASDTSIDTLLLAMIVAAETEITNESGALGNTDALDLMLLVDTAVWNYQSRDKATGMPEWLRYKRRQRFLRVRGAV